MTDDCRTAKESDLAPQTLGDTSEVPLLRIPSPPPLIAAWVEKLAERIDAMRQANNKQHTAGEERNLAVRVERAIEHSKPEFDPELIRWLSLPAAQPDESSPAEKLQQWTLCRASKFWPISVLMYSGNIQNITCLGAHRWIAAVGNKKFEYVTNYFADDKAVADWFERILRTDGVKGHRNLSDASPYAEASLNQFRLTFLIDPLLCGPSSVGMSIRVPQPSRFRALADYAHPDVGTLTNAAALFVDRCVRAKANIIISGGTDTGKTSFLRVCCGLIAEPDMVVSVEDAPELRLSEWQYPPDAEATTTRGQLGKKWVRLLQELNTVPTQGRIGEYNVDLRSCVRGCLRLSPDRIIVGETRGQEAADMIWAMSSGHEGCMTTLHATDVRAAIKRLVVFLCQTNQYTEKLAEDSIRNAVNLIIQLEKDGRSGARLVTQIVNVDASGNDVTVYALDGHGVLAPKSPSLGDLDPRLRKKLEALPEPHNLHGRIPR